MKLTTDPDTLGSYGWATEKGFDTSGWRKPGGRWILEQLRLLTNLKFLEVWWQRMLTIKIIQWSTNDTKKWTFVLFYFVNSNWTEKKCYVSAFAVIVDAVVKISNSSFLSKSSFLKELFLIHILNIIIRKSTPSV